MRLLATTAGAVVLLTEAAVAHGGFENETEVRVEAERMRIVVRTSVAFAWRMLGDRAPAAADEAGQATAKPLLAESAKGLFEVTAGGDPMAPVKADCFFESHDLHDHAAFTIDYARPAAWPVTVTATFFPRLGELDDGTIAVFDQTASRFNRDVEPLVRKSLRAADPAVTFDLTGVKAADGAPAANSRPVPPAGAIDPPDRWPWWPATLIGALLAGGAALILRKRSGTAG